MPGDGDATHRRLRRRYRPVAVDGEGLFLLGERDSHVLEGQVFVDLLPHLARGVAEHDAADELADAHPREVTHYAFRSLERRGLMAPAKSDGAAGEEAFWDELGLDPHQVGERLAGTDVAVTAVGGVDAGPTVQALGNLGVRARAAGAPAGEAFHVVLAADYLEPGVARLAGLNEEAGRSWLPCRASGREVWVGPVLGPEQGCYECLSWYLQTNGALRTYLSRKLPEDETVRRPSAQMPAHARLVAELAALTAAKWVAGRTEEQTPIRTLDLGTWESEAHPLRRRPQCPSCGNPGLQAELAMSPVRLDPGEAPAATELAELERFVDRLTGIVTSVERTETGMPSLHSYRATFGFGRDATDLEAFRRGLLSQAAGVGTSAGEAKVGAICEALERYSGMTHGDEPALPASYSQLDPATAVHPGECMLYSRRQYDSRQAINARGEQFDLVPEPFDPDALLFWTGVWSLTGKRFKLLPTSYLYYGHSQPPGGPYCWADSNGCAAGRTIADAVRRGLLELIERDSVAIWWYNRLRRPRVDLASFESPYFDGFVKSYQALGREVWVLDVTTDLQVPSFVAVSPNRSGGPEDILLSFGAGLDPGAAIEHALCEMNHILPAVLEANRTPDGDYAYPDPAQKRWWATATVASEPYLTPDDSGPARGAGDYERIAAGDQVDAVHVIQERLEALGLELLVLDQTRPDVGVPVAKVLVPGLRHFWSRFAPGRLYDVPVALRWLPRPRLEQELNPISMFL